jgi:hypothetical protein
VTRKLIVFVRVSFAPLQPLMNAGFPLTGIGLGSIVSALELPVSVTMALSY